MAHKTIARRPEPYWDAYFYVWGVKVGSFKRPFYIHHESCKQRIVADNFSLARSHFGQFLAGRIVAEGSGPEVAVVPIPSKDAVLGRELAYRSLAMTSDALSATDFSDSVVDGLRWRAALPKAHEGGVRDRDFLKQRLAASDRLIGRDVVLVDDLLSTGGSLLAASELLVEAGANVLGAVVCGKTIYNFDVPPFGQQEFYLEEELADYGK